MRVILVGPAADRARLRAEMNGSVDVVAEYAEMAQASAASVEADAIVLTRKASRDEPAMPESLTSREVQVLELMAEGLPNKAIAVQLGISDQTVKFHVAAISGKLGARNRTEAVRRALQRGLIAL